MLRKAKKMNKPLTMIIKETKTKLIDVCNESELPPVILDLIIQGVCSEIHAIVERQSISETMEYEKSIKGNVIDEEGFALEGDANEQ
jgi:hypothetical protein